MGILNEAHLRAGKGVVWVGCMATRSAVYTVWVMARFSVIVAQQKDKLKNLTAAIDNLMQSGISLAEDVMVSSDNRCAWLSVKV